MSTIPRRRISCPAAQLLLFHNVFAILWSILLIQNLNPTHATDEALDMYCGTTWIDAFENCPQACPSGSDSDCTEVGHSCHGYTGCAAKSGGSNGNNGLAIGAGNDGGGDDTYKNNMCGVTWLTAMLSCSKPCPPGTDCPGGQTCFAATNCDKPMSPIISKMIMSLLGDYDGAESMDSMARGVFSESVLTFLAEKMEENRVAVNGADVTGQSFVEQGGRRRKLQWNDTVTGEIMTVELSLEQQRRLATGSSALDVSMTITGEYRPPPYQDMDLLIEDSINRASLTMVQDLQSRGTRGGTQFFERVNDLAATRVTAATQRPTQKPTQWPTMSPTTKPTKEPTKEPTETPTETPSSSPTRASEQMLQSGFGEDLYVGTSRSFGNIFEVKTKPDAETILVKGLDFYSTADARVSYEVWTKEGSWQGFEGKIESFTKIAEGQVRSKGLCDETTADNCNFVQIPFDKFSSVAIRGGGETRSFYITLTTKEIMYKRGDSTSIEIQVENPDIEIYEGAGVLLYPFSKATDAMHYRQPRGFLGRIWYERNPCEDGGNEWPCQTRSPVTQLQSTSSKPTKQPTNQPTPKPTRRARPTAPKTPPPTKQELSPPAPKPTPAIPNENAVSTEGEEPTVAPSPKPIVEYSYDEAGATTTNIVVTLHNVENEPMTVWETKKYSQVVIEYLRSHPSLQVASVDVLNVTVWHQEVVDDGSKFRGKGKRPANSDSRSLQEESEDFDSTVKVGASEEATDEVPAGSTVEGANNTASLPSEESDSVITMVVGSSDEATDEVTAGAKVEDVQPTDSLSVDSSRVSMEITTIIKTANSVLPSDVTDVLLLHVIEEGNAALINRLHAESFYSYFADIDDISGRIILKITAAPSPSPTTQSQMLAVNINVHSANEQKEKEMTNLYTLVGVVVGGLWCMLTLFSLCYLAKARGEMKNDNLLRNETSSNRNQDDYEPEKEMSAFHNSFVDADMDHTGDTAKLMDDLVSHASGGYTGLFDIEEGNSEDSTQPTTFSDIFPGVPEASQANGNSKSQVADMKAKALGGRGSFDNRLRNKLSASATVSGETKQQESAPPTHQMSYKQKVSEADGDAPGRTRRSTTFAQRLQLKMSVADGDSKNKEEAKQQDSAPPTHRMSYKQKVSEADGDASGRTRRHTTFAQRLQLKMSVVDGDSTNKSGGTVTQATAPPPKQKRHTIDVSSSVLKEEKKSEDLGDPLQLLFGSADTSKQEPATDPDVSADRRRSDEDETPNLSLPKPQKNRRVTANGRLERGKKSEGSSKSLESATSKGKKTKGRANASGASSTEQRKSRKRSGGGVRSSVVQKNGKSGLDSSKKRPDKSKTKKRPSDLSAASNEKDPGTNMVEMLFA